VSFHRRVESREDGSCQVSFFPSSKFPFHKVKLARFRVSPDFGESLKIGHPLRSSIKPYVPVVSPPRGVSSVDVRAAGQGHLSVQLPASGATISNDDMVIEASSDSVRVEVGGSDLTLCISGVRPRLVFNPGMYKLLYSPPPIA
jgi:hypothetical protein